MSEDLIKREDAIEALKGREGILADAYTAVAIIRAIPSADRPQGEWIYIDEPIIGNPYGRYKCSKCNLEEPFESDYCPNCGAKMKGADDE